MPILRAQYWPRLALGLLLLDQPFAMADSIWIGQLERKGVSIHAFGGGQIEFTVNGRIADPIPAQRIDRLVVEGETAFNQAELAFANQEWSTAAGRYMAAEKATARPWLKRWIWPRLLTAADRAGRYDLAVTAFVQMLFIDPSQAIERWPGMPPEPTADHLAAAMAELKAASLGRGLDPVQKRAVSTMLLDACRAAGDRVAAKALADQLQARPAADEHTPAGRKVMAEMHLVLARWELSLGDPEASTHRIRAHQSLFALPRQATEALYVVAQAEDRRTGVRLDESALKQLAIAYMRVVSADRNTPTHRHAPLALFRVAELEQARGDVRSAAMLYAQIASEYKDSASAARAQEQHRKLTAGEDRAK